MLRMITMPARQADNKLVIAVEHVGIEVVAARPHDGAKFGINAHLAEVGGVLQRGGSMLVSGVREHNFSALGLLQPADEDGRIDNRYAVKPGVEQIAVERHKDIGMCCVHQRDEIVVVGIAHPRGL